MGNKEKTMSENSYPWVKIKNSYRRDSSLVRLPKTTQCNYFYFYMIACESASEGLMALNGKILSIDDIAWELRCDPEEIGISIDLLTKSGLMHFDEGFIISRFVEEQGPEGPGDTQEKKRATWRKAQEKSRSKINGRPSKDDYEDDRPY